MLVQTRQICEILIGRNSGWESQVRKGSMPSWGVVLRRHWIHVAAGVVTGIAIAYLAPGQLIWLSPILAGLILAPLTSRWSASPVLGRWARQAGLLVTPEERSIPPVMAESVNQSRRLRVPGDATALLGRNAEDRQDYIALIPAQAPRPIAERLPSVSAAAKIAVAENQRQALQFLDRDELQALLNDADLIEIWARLPQ